MEMGFAEHNIMILTNFHELQRIPRGIKGSLLPSFHEKHFKLYLLEFMILMGQTLMDIFGQICYLFR